MFRKLALSFILTVSAFAASKFSFAITYVDNGTATNYNLTSSDSLFIATGTYTGSITGFDAGARITVSNLATFQPASMPNNAAGTMYVYGTSIITQTTFRTNTSFTLNNYGMFIVNANVIMNGNNQTWTNNYGGIINFNSNVTMNGDLGNNNRVINYETINCSGNFQMNSGSAFTNYKDFSGGADVILNGGSYNNEGNFVITGQINMNSGTSIIRNYCRMEASGGIDNSAGSFYNYSYLWAKNSDIRNTANIINSSVASSSSVPAVTTPMIHGRNYTNSGSGTMTGPALLYFYGTTTMTGGTMGVPGTTADTIKMYDITRTTPPNIFDVQSGGTRHPNLIYNAWGVPDSNKVYLLGCSIEVILESPLAIKWNYFYVNLVNNIPALIWSAAFDRSTTFEIQRSYDGSLFSAIKTVPSESGRSQYKFDDELVNVNVPVVYYRIKATQISGVEKYTQIRMVRFGNKPGSIFMAPNPFTNNFIINYTATEKGMINVRMFNASGQLKLMKNVIVNDGNNSINITEAAQFTKGVYVIQVSNGHSIISSGKVIKR